MSHQAINRWFLAVTLFQNLSLVKYRGVPEKPKKKVVFPLKMQTIDSLHRPDPDNIFFKSVHPVIKSEMPVEVTIRRVISLARLNLLFQNFQPCCSLV